MSLEKLHPTSNMIIDNNQLFEEKVITLLLNEQFELRSSEISTDVIEEEEIIYDAIGRGENTVNKMDRTITTLAMLTSTISLINNVDDILKLIDTIDDRLNKVNSLETALSVLSDSVKIYEFLGERKDYLLYKSLENTRKTQLVSAYDETIKYFESTLNKVSVPTTIAQVLSQATYIDKESLAILKQAVPIIFHAGACLKIQAETVTSLIVESRSNYLTSLLQKITPPPCADQDDIIAFSVGYERNKNPFISTLKHILSLFQNERIFHREILAEDFEPVFVNSVDSSLNHVFSLYTAFVNVLKALDTPFVVFPILDVIIVFEEMKDDLVAALKVELKPKGKSRWLKVSPSFNIMGALGRSKNEEEEDEDEGIFTEEEEDKRDKMTKRVDLLWDEMFKYVKEFLTRFKDESLQNSTLNKLLSWTESSIPVDATVSQLAADTMKYLTKLGEYLPKLDDYMAGVLGFKKSHDEKQNAFVAMYVEQCIRNLCVMFETRADKEKTRLGKVYKMNNYVFIVDICNLENFDSLLGKENRLKIIEDFNIKKENALYEYGNTFNSLNKLLNARPGKKPDIKKTFSTFNKEFQELFSIQKTYNVYNEELKSQLKAKLMEMIHKPYASFYANYETAKFTQNPDKYLQYLPQTVEDSINLMFEAKIEEGSKTITDYIPGFRQPTSRIVPKLSTISSLATPIQNLPQTFKNISHKPSEMVHNPVKGTKKVFKKFNPF
ncbi:Exocyst subunit Exo70 family protein [Entamoeba marina]